MGANGQHRLRMHAPPTAGKRQKADDSPYVTAGDPTTHVPKLAAPWRSGCHHPLDADHRPGRHSPQMRAPGLDRAHTSIPRSEGGPMRRPSHPRQTLPLLALLLLLVLSSLLVWGLTGLTHAAGLRLAAWDPWPAVLVVVLLALAVGAYGCRARR
jgi:hypothetical protein